MLERPAFPGDTVGIADVNLRERGLRLLRERHPDRCRTGAEGRAGGGIEGYRARVGARILRSDSGDQRNE